MARQAHIDKLEATVEILRDSALALQAFIEKNDLPENGKEAKAVEAVYNGIGILEDHIFEL